MKRTINIRIAIGVIFLVTIAFSGTSIENDRKETIRVGFIPVTHCIPLYIAEEDGLLAKVGLKVEMVPLQGGPKILEALVAGSIEIGFSNVGFGNYRPESRHPYYSDLWRPNRDDTTS